jgi:ketosteroid isomerase-like protein
MNLRFFRSLLCGLAVLSASSFARAQSNAAENNSTEAQVLAVEKARIAAVLGKDVKALDSICADDLTYIHASGRVDNKASYIEAIRSDELHYIAWEPKELHVRAFGDTAVLNGEYHVRVINRRMQPDPLDMNVFILTVYVKRAGRWQQVAWQTTRDVGAAAVGVPPSPTGH